MNVGVDEISGLLRQALVAPYDSVSHLRIDSLGRIKELAGSYRPLAHFVKSSFGE